MRNDASVRMFDRRAVPFRRGITTQNVLITLAVVFIVIFLACAGAGAFVYFWVQRNFANLAVTDPAKIRSLTTEMVDISIPPEFVPQNASSIFGMKIATYQWCPSGTCPPDDSSALTLSVMSFMGNDAEAIKASQAAEEEELKLHFSKFTRETREFEIRGQKCQFIFCFGHAAVDEDPAGDNSPPEISSNKSNPQVAEQSSPNPAENSDVSSTDDVPADATAPASTKDEPPVGEPAKGPQMWRIQGQFPAKAGTCTMVLQLKPEEYDEEKILKMIRSIR